MINFIGKNLYIFFAGLILVSYLFTLIIITVIDQKQIQDFQKKEINSYIESKAGDLEYFFDVLKKNISNVSQNKSLSTYFLNKALGMSMEYGLEVNINKINRFLSEVIISERIKDNPIFKDIILIDLKKNIISSEYKIALQDLKTLENLDILKADNPYIKIAKNRRDIYILKNVFVNEKVLGTLVFLIDLENIFNNLITKTDQFILVSEDILLTKSDLSSKSILENKKYIEVSISNTPFSLYGKVNEREYESFFSKWFSFSLAFLAIPILIVLYYLILLNNKNIKLSEEIKNSIKDKQNEKIILQQSKVAAIGEMIGNIAHQWRQPLSVITAQVTGIKLSLEFEKELSKKELINIMDNINNQAQHLSKTIDDFRSFFKGNTNDINEFEVKNTLENVKNLTKDTFNNNFIEYNASIEECKLKGNENILIQALINIYNNAKDALVNNGFDEKLFYVEAKKEANDYVITIKDNGKGIPDNIIEKVFEPYFTTKHKSVGTGIGLYMTNQIITKQFKGSIFVTNEKYSAKGKDFVGAQFKIKIPLDFS